MATTGFSLGFPEKGEKMAATKYAMRILFQQNLEDNTNDYIEYTMQRIKNRSHCSLLCPTPYFL